MDNQTAGNAKPGTEEVLSWLINELIKDKQRLESQREAQLRKLSEFHPRSREYLKVKTWISGLNCRIQELAWLLGESRPWNRVNQKNQTGEWRPSERES